MATLSAPQSRRAVRLTAAAIITLLMVDGTMLYLRQGPAPVDADLALQRFRDQAATVPSEPSALPDDTAGAVDSATPQGAVDSPAAEQASPAPGAPPPADQAATGAPPPPPGSAQPSAPASSRASAGVYEYRTQGYEEVAAFGGSRHDYPATTYITLTHTSCGSTMRWQPLEERWDQTELCGDAAQAEIRTFTMYHEFFQSGKTDVYHCGPGEAVVYRRDAAPGDTWNARCAGDSGAMDMKVQIVGVEPVTVAGRAIQALRIRYDGVATGDSRGTQVQERWFDRSNGMLLRLTTDIKVRTKTPLGESDYREQYRLDLASLKPRT